MYGLMMRKTILRSDRGDTIVEVLLALVVMGVVLAGSYNLANRSLIVNQNAAERTEAVNLLREQLELATAVGGSFACTNNDTFYMDHQGTTIVRATSDTRDDIFEVSLRCSNAPTTAGVSEITATAEWQALGASSAASGQQVSTMVLRIGQ